MKTKTPRTLLPPFSLRRLRTCSKLVEWLETPPVGPERQFASQTRAWYAANPRRLELLKLCGDLSATHHRSHLMTARHLAAVPTIEMKVAGGKPDKEKMPPFTAALKRIGAMNGIVIHRWESGAFILHHPKKEQPLKTEPFGLVN